MGFCFRVQSSDYDPVYLQGRIDNFIDGVKELLVSLNFSFGLSFVSSSMLYLTTCLFCCFGFCHNTFSKSRRWFITHVLKYQIVHCVEIYVAWSRILVASAAV